MEGNKSLVTRFLRVASLTAIGIAIGLAIARIVGTPGTDPLVMQWSPLPGRAPNPVAAEASQPRLEDTNGDRLPLQLVAQNEPPQSITLPQLAPAIIPPVPPTQPKPAPVPRDVTKLVEQLEQLKQQYVALATEQERVNVGFWEQRQSLVAHEAEVKAALAEQLRELLNRVQNAGVSYEPPLAKVPDAQRLPGPMPTVIPSNAGGVSTPPEPGQLTPPATQFPPHPELPQSGG
jgi:hypothetical protein